MRRRTTQVTQFSKIVVRDCINHLSLTTSLARRHAPTEQYQQTNRTRIESKRSSSCSGERRARLAHAPIAALAGTQFARIFFAYQLCRNRFVGRYPTRSNSFRLFYLASEINRSKQFEPRLRRDTIARRTCKRHRIIRRIVYFSAPIVGLPVICSCFCAAAYEVPCKNKQNNPSIIAFFYFGTSHPIIRTTFHGDPGRLCDQRARRRSQASRRCLAWRRVPVNSTAIIRRALCGCVWVFFVDLLFPQL
jgi:hypothetical protein